MLYVICYYNKEQTLIKAKKLKNKFNDNSIQFYHINK